MSTKNIKLLDCTLRDGGYVNNFNFGENTIKEIITRLVESRIDIIECGFLSDIDYNADKTLFNNIKELNNLIKPKSNNTMYVGMIALGAKEISCDRIDNRNIDSIDGVRITFHEYEIEKAVLYANNLINKGYEIFMQPVGTTIYSDSNLLKLIERVNELKPYAFYIVDTLGTMYKNDLLRLFYLIDHNLDSQIAIGFHSHNNLQMSFANAQELMLLHTKRQLIIDSSVYGMGRGVGNLNTELITQYYNDYIEDRYPIIPLLQIIDENLNAFITQYSWGYSTPYYLAAIKKCHPNYSSYLLNKQMIPVKQINEILDSIPVSKRHLFNNDLINFIYLDYQEHLVNDIESINSLSSLLSDRKILLIAPGKSIIREEKKIQKFISSENPLVLSINFFPDNFTTDITFISNTKRYNTLVYDANFINSNITKVVTSNILTDSKENLLILDYKKLLTQNEFIKDNAGIMLLNLCLRLEIKEVFLAGWDGFSLNKSDNFYIDRMASPTERESLEALNAQMIKEINSIKEKMNLVFITDSIYNRC